MTENAVSPDTPRQATATRNWRTAYARRLAITDFLVVVWVVFGSHIAWLGSTRGNVTFLGRLSDVAISYTVLSIVLILAWMLVLGIYGTRGFRVIGTGSTEYKLITNSSVRLFGIVAIAALLLKVDLARGYIITALPLGVLVLLFSRWMWRQWLNVQRERGAYSDRILLVGSIPKVTYLATELDRRFSAGYLVIGVCVPDGLAGDNLPGSSIAIRGDFDQVTEVASLMDVDAVALAGAESLLPEVVRQMSWDLETTRAELIVAPSLIDVAGSRIHTRPVAGLPLIHVEIPRFEGRKQVAKLVFDICFAALIVAVLSPLLLVLAVLVKFTSPGPIIFKQQRIGLNGTTFRMLKFRSMVKNAEARLNEFGDSDVVNRTLFKPKNDPRVTGFGRFLRRYSLDELPQLFNVLGGSMSLVGPRPHPAREVSKYEATDRRRLLVRPGLTGLWQIGGRSRLSWQESVRLDLYYVENWSLTGDLVILWRTARAVFGADGAY